MPDLHTIEITPSTEIIAASPYPIIAVLKSKMSHSNLIYGDAYPSDIDQKEATLHLLQCEYDLGTEYVFELGGKKSYELTLTVTENTYDVITLLWPKEASSRRL